ncbi:hypothetical protein L9F63_008681, partial [Diploptera punctata]
LHISLQSKETMNLKEAYWPENPGKHLTFGEAEKNKTDYRLDDNIKPSSYVINLQPDFGNFTFYGEVMITISASSPTNTITLHYNIMNITETTLLDKENNKTLNTNNTSDESKNFYIITAEEDLNADVNYYLNIKYVGYLINNSNIFYRSKCFENYVAAFTWLASTQFESTGARRAFPCFDEPKFKATFQINILRDGSRTSLSNAPLVETKQVDKVGSLFMDVFEVTPVMSSYLVAFVVSDFTRVNLTDEENNRTYSVWTQPELIDDANFALNISVQLINSMVEFTDFDFEFHKMDQAAIPDFSAGAMENWGLVTYRERLILVNHEKASVENEKQVATTISHEFGHQWFGDLVSPEWWKYIWLNEGFATYMEYFGVHTVKPEWRLDEQFVVDVIQNALAVDGVNSSHPITTDVYTPDEISSNFDNIIYDKAGSVLRSTEHFLTTDTFKKALQNYLKI